MKPTESSKNIIINKLKTISFLSIPSRMGLWCFRLRQGYTTRSSMWSLPGLQREIIVSLSRNVNTDAHGWSCWIFTRHQLQQDIATVVIRQNMLKMSCHVVFRCYNWTNFVLWTKKKCYHQSSYFLTVNTWHCEMICMNLQGLSMIVRPLPNVNSLMRSELSRITLDNQRDNASSYFCFLEAILCKFHII